MTELFPNKYQTSTLGIDITVPCSASVEAYDQRAGKSGACLEDAIAGLVAWSTLPDIQDKFAEALEKASNIARLVDADATEKARAKAKDPAKVKDVLEKPRAYKNRVWAQASDDDKKEYTNLLREIASQTPADPAPSARAKGVPKDLLAKADSLLTLSDDELEAKVGKYLAAVEFDLARDNDGRPDRESLAVLVGKFLDTML